MRCVGTESWGDDALVCALMRGWHSLTTTDKITEWWRQRGRLMLGCRALKASESVRPHCALCSAHVTSWTCLRCWRPSLLLVLRKLTHGMLQDRSSELLQKKKKKNRLRSFKLLHIACCQKFILHFRILNITDTRSFVHVPVRIYTCSQHD